MSSSVFGVAFEVIVLSVLVVEVVVSMAESIGIGALWCFLSDSGMSRPDASGLVFGVVVLEMVLVEVELVVLVVSKVLVVEVEVVEVVVEGVKRGELLRT